MRTSKRDALRREVEAQPRGRGQRYAEDLRERLAAHAAERRTSGESWDSIGADLGVTGESLRRWCSRATELKPVRVVADRTSEQSGRMLSVISASGFRVEGLTLDEATAMLRALQ